MVSKVLSNGAIIVGLDPNVVNAVKIVQTSLRHGNNSPGEYEAVKELDIPAALNLTAEELFPPQHTDAKDFATFFEEVDIDTSDESLEDEQEEEGRDLKGKKKKTKTPTTGAPTGKRGNVAPTRKPTQEPSAKPTHKPSSKSPTAGSTKTPTPQPQTVSDGYGVNVDQIVRCDGAIAWIDDRTRTALAKYTANGTKEFFDVNGNPAQYLYSYNMNPCSVDKSKNPVWGGIMPLEYVIPVKDATCKP